MTHPQTWQSFIGNELAVRQIRTAAKSAKLRGEPMAHTLIASGTAGCGKSALAHLAGMEMDATIYALSGRVTVDEARITLAQMSDGDVLLYDEIHMAVVGGKANAEWLLHLLQDGVILGPRGPERCPAITMIGATTDVGRLPETIIGRFPLQPQLEPYSPSEAVEIAMSMAGSILTDPLPFPELPTFARVAQAGNRNPRAMRQILSNLRDIATVRLSDGKKKIYDVTEALTWQGLSSDGLSNEQRKYLTVLMDEFMGCAGAQALADRLNEPSGVRHIERELMTRGLVAITSRGRVLTGDGIQRAQKENAA